MIDTTVKINEDEVISLIRKHLEELHSIKVDSIKTIVTSGGTFRGFEVSAKTIVTPIGYVDSKEATVEVTLEVTKKVYLEGEPDESIA